MTELARITIRPEQCGGRPCIRGLRVRVKDILDLLAAGASREEILADYPYLESADITAALGGTLTITSINNYVPQSGDSFTILTFAARAKTDFANAPAAFALSYDDGMGTLTLIAQ